jgi:ribonucleoside-diphosphate reductase alpha chain
VEQEDGDTLYDLTVPSNETYLASPPGTGAFVVVHNTGYSFSRLRPEGDLIRKSGGEASGPVSFMRLYHEAMTVVKRAGKKHAAQMGILNVSHPDIVKFVRCKEEEGRLSTFNISVAVSDDFMEAVRNDSDWDLTFGGKVYDTIPAKELYHLIAEHAWRNGEPGVIFIDEINRQNPFPVPIEACNACGEKPLPYNCSCNLASINLSKFVDDNGIIDWNGIEEHTRLGVRFLDVAIDRAWWPLEEVERNTKKYRNIGLGVMGWADMLIKMRIPYDSDTAVALASGLMAFINDVAHDESQGRNTTLTSIAPTGSISMLAGCSPSIEPLFGLVTNKQTNLGLSQEIHSEFKKRAEELGIASEALWADVSAQQSVQHLDIPQSDKEIFKTAMEIPWERHLMMQAAFQESVDSAVSKTINLENSATIQDVKDAIMLAEALGCKSLTLYRDGSRSEQVYVRTCPDCEAELVSESGCWSCPDCGYSLCSL